MGDKDTIIFDPHENQEYITSRNHVEVTFYDDSTQSGNYLKEAKEGLREKIKNSRLGYGLAVENKGRVQLSQCVAFIGLPNSGKSSLLNKLTKQELSAVSSKSHTTNQNVLVVQNYLTH